MIIKLLSDLYPRWEPTDEQLRTFNEGLSRMQARNPQLLEQAVRDCYAEKSSARTPNLGEIRGKFRAAEAGAMARSGEAVSDGLRRRPTDEEVEAEHGQMRRELAQGDPAEIATAAEEALSLVSWAPRAVDFLQAGQPFDWSEAPLNAVGATWSIWRNGRPSRASVVRRDLGRWDTETEAGRIGHWRDLVSWTRELAEVSEDLAVDWLNAAGDAATAQKIVEHGATLPAWQRRGTMRTLFFADEPIRAGVLS